MQHIETVTVGSGGAASITFMSVGDIPSEYTDLLLVLSLRTTHTGSNWGEVTIRPNNSSSNLSRRTLFGTGSSPGSESTSAWRMWGASNDATANTFANGSIYIPNYRSGVAKSASFDNVTETNATAALQSISAGLWNDTNPITSIVIEAEASKLLMQYSSASLYGITAGTDGITAVS